MKKTALLVTFLQVSCFSFGQVADSTKTPAFFSGVITATNNGISLLPNFSLNKPAVLFDLSAGKGRLSFDPMFRFGMDGKPWTFVFWWRYKLVTQPRFSLSLGAHPSFVFRTVKVTINGVTDDKLIAQRYVAWEATPTYIVNKKLSFGIYYLGSHGLTKDLAQLTHFITLRCILTNINLFKQYSLTLLPQVYYLKMDELDGTYITATAILAKKNFPLSISSIVSQAFKTEIAGDKFIWNVGLNYNFNKKYQAISKS